MRNFPGATRGRHVEITTKGGNTVAGRMLRHKAETDIVQLGFTTDDGVEAVVSVDVESIDVMIVGDRVVDEEE